MKKYEFKIIFQLKSNETLFWQMNGKTRSLNDHAVCFRPNFMTLTLLMLEKCLDFSLLGFPEFIFGLDPLPQRTGSETKWKKIN